jgi:hypothetical protein
MFPSLQNTQRNQAIQPANQASRIRIKKVFRLLQLLTAVLFALFFAGIAAPSFIRSELARNYALASGSLHSLTIAHLTFSYTFWNLASALLGALFGATVVLVDNSPARLGPVARIGNALQQMGWKSLLFRKDGRPSFIGNHLT